MKQPHIQLYTGDWLKDPHLSVCSPASRGVWIDLICAMHELDRCGELRGTGDQLARLARCNTVELEAALTDLQNNRAAEVQYRNGSWLVANRRMKQESDIRLKRAESGSLGGSKAQANRIANREQIPEDEVESSSSISFEKSEKLFFDEWNEIAPRKAEKVTEKRRLSLRQRLGEPYFRDNYRTAFGKVKKSAFCQGESERGWKADVDWFLRPDTVVKIMEGKYDNTNGSSNGNVI